MAGKEGGHRMSAQNVPGAKMNIFNMQSFTGLRFFFRGVRFFRECFTDEASCSLPDLGEHSRSHETEVSWFCLFFTLGRCYHLNLPCKQATEMPQIELPWKNILT